MTNEEWERKVEFIVGQQAQFASDIQQLKELHTQAEVRMTRIENLIVTAYEVTDAKIKALSEDTTAKINALVDAQMRLAESQAKTDEKLDALTDSHLRLQDSHLRLEASHLRVEASHARLEDSLTRLAKSHAETDESLKSLMNVVERHISEGHHGANKN